MKAARPVMTFLVAWSLQGGIAFAHADWLDRLSGPGPFWGWDVDYRFLCATRIADQPDFRATNPAEENVTFLIPLSPLDQAAGVVPLNDPGDPDPVTGMRVSLRASNLGEYRRQNATINCKADRAVRGYMSLKVGQYWSTENNLFPNDRDNPLYQVRIAHATLRVAARLHPALDLSASFGANRFSGDAFDSFWRPSIVPVSLSFYPGGLMGDSQTHRSVKIEFAFLTFLGRMDETDFCTPGVLPPGGCANVRDFESSKELLPRWTFFIDPVLLRPLFSAVVR